MPLITYMIFFLALFVPFHVSTINTASHATCRASVYCFVCQSFQELKMAFLEQRTDRVSHDWSLSAAVDLGWNGRKQP